MSRPPPRHPGVRVPGVRVPANAASIEVMILSSDWSVLLILASDWSRTSSSPNLCRVPGLISTRGRLLHRDPPLQVTPASTVPRMRCSTASRTSTGLWVLRLRVVTTTDLLPGLSQHRPPVIRVLRRQKSMRSLRFATQSLLQPDLHPPRGHTDLLRANIRGRLRINSTRPDRPVLTMTSLQVDRGRSNKTLLRRVRVSTAPGLPRLWCPPPITRIIT